MHTLARRCTRCRCRTDLARRRGPFRKSGLQGRILAACAPKSALPESPGLAARTDIRAVCADETAVAGEEK